MAKHPMFPKDLPESLHVPFSPYTYTRVMVMKGKLYKKQDYDKLLKMQGNEIAAYLEQSDYKEDILHFAKEHSGYALVELSLQHNLARQLSKLRNISLAEMQALLDIAILRYDLYNLKTLLRAKAAGQQFSAVSSLFISVGQFKTEKLRVFFDAPSITVLLQQLGITDKHVLSALHIFEKEQSLHALENALDALYYESVFSLLSTLSGDHILFKQLLQAEIDVLNVKLLFRQQQTKPSSYFFFKGGAVLSKSILQRLVHKDLSAIVSALEKTPFRSVVSSSLAELEAADFRKFEKRLDVWLFKKALLLSHQYPLSVDTVLGYLFAKEIEVRNLRIIVKGKQFGLSEQFIIEQLVIP